MDIIFVLAGLAGLFVGGEALVRGAVAIAQRLSLPPLLIGLTVVGFGTSMPELLVSLQAALKGAPDIAIGNIIGSNIANILLILGITALVWPIRVSGGSLKRDLVVMIAAALALIPLFVGGQIGRGAGLALFAGLVCYLLWAFLTPGDAPEDDAPPAGRSWKSVLWVALGLALLLVGARLLVDGSSNIARQFGVSEAFIGLTVVAVGTSLPELATSVVAALKRQSDIAVGNIVGSNIFNVLGILGVTAVVSPVPVTARFAAFDLPVMIGASVVLAALLLARPVVGRVPGALLLLGYGAYVWAAQG
ncbi:calcium/sodium antiporter [Citreicella sp. C3M06]|uniref:calcium/sodium antiporter n=1 Tax=Citreicella sp. C3M06 TaxID=2841564 RepID=UPI001C093B3B|nr:calcium/sodium antiporter [Citreicella sp. C3M06]MBU2959886.1 calcium/sodium antiporter [Citreicella sp. C3M06]